MLVIFDCDGVLVDSEPIAAEVNVEMLKELDFEITARDMVVRFFGLTGPVIAERLEAEMGRSLPEDFKTKAEAEIDRRLAKVKAIAGVHEMLDVLDAPVCVASNSNSTRLKISLGATKLYDRFRPYVFSATEVGTKLGKPDPNVFLHAAKTFDISPENCFVVEDSPTGIAAAMTAGMRVIGFTGGGHTFPGHADILTEAGAITVLNKLSDIPAVVEALKDWNPADL